MSLLNFSGGWTMPTTFDLSAWQTPTVDVSPVEEEVDLFADTTQDFSVNTLMPNINTSEGNLLGFQEIEMTPEQKVQYGIANEQEATQVANDPFAALKQIDTNIKQAATTPEGAAQITALQDNAAKVTTAPTPPNLSSVAEAELASAQAAGDETKIALATQAVDAANRLEESQGTESLYTGDIYGGFESNIQNELDWQNYQNAMGAVSNYDYAKWKAGTQSNPTTNPLFNLAANALTGGGWSAATGAFNTIDAAVNEEWGDALKSGAMTYANYNTVEANSLLDKADDLDAMGYADAADTLRSEAASLKDTASAVGGIKDIVNGDVFSGMLTGAPLIGVDPVGSVMETVFGVSAEEDALNNAKFGGGWDVSAASEGIVDAAGTLLDTGDIGQAAQSGLLTYAKEGGSTPFEIPQGEGYWGIPSFNLGKYLPDVDIDVQVPEWLRFNPDFDIEGWKASGLTIPDWLKINGGGIDFGNLDINLDVNNPFDNLDINLPKVPSIDIGLPKINPDINVPEFDVNLSGFETDFNVDGFDIGEYEGFNTEVPKLPSFDFDLSLGDGTDLEGIVTDPRWKKVPNINTVATLLQKMTPKQKQDYLEMLLRSMQA